MGRQAARRTIVRIAVVYTVAVALMAVWMAGTASANSACYYRDPYTPCAWLTTGHGHTSTWLIMANNGGNFSIGVSGGNTFQGCYLSGYYGTQCDVPHPLRPWTIRALVYSLFPGTPVYAVQVTGGAENTTLYHPCC